MENETKKTMQILATLFFAALFTTVSVKAQSTTLKLPTTDDTSDFSITDNAGTPVTLFKLSADGTLLSNGTFVSSTTAPSLGTGTRLWWYPKKAAFRAGHATTEWDGLNVGDYSFATGDRTTASGGYSTAMGLSSTASGINSVVIGRNSTASGNYSRAIGYFIVASGENSTAMGNKVSTNSKSGSFIIGDFSTSTVTNSTATNQMMMRFAGGYVLYTNSGLTTGAQLAAGANSWSTVSDSTKKYAFLPVNGESVLDKIDKFNLRSWSYKGQDSTKFRHYGPMAQEFFAAFGHDKYGVAGNNTTINQADFEGINLIAIQALERKVRSQNLVVSRLEQELKLQKEAVTAQQKQIKELNKIKTEFTLFKQAVEKLLMQIKGNSKIKLTMDK